MIPRNRRIINLQAIEENMRLLRSVTPSTAKMMAVVKADGYGHGAAETAEAAIRGGARTILHKPSAHRIWSDGVNRRHPTRENRPKSI